MHLLAAISEKGVKLITRRSLGKGCRDAAWPASAADADQQCHPVGHAGRHNSPPKLWGSEGWAPPAAPARSRGDHPGPLRWRKLRDPQRAAGTLPGRCLCVLAGTLTYCSGAGSRLFCSSKLQRLENYHPRSCFLFGRAAQGKKPQ